MKYNALGLIEVKGYLGAVAAADTALKAAGVNCIGLEVIKGGLVTVKLSGEVGAVQAAVDAGAEIASELNVLLTRHVIPRVHEETASMIESPVDASASTGQRAEEIADSIPVDVNPPATAANTKAGEIKPEADTGKATADTLKQVTNTSKPSGGTDNLPEPESDIVVALEQADTKPARGKAKDSHQESVPAAKRSKNAKKASS